MKSAQDIRLLLDTAYAARTNNLAESIHLANEALSSSREIENEQLIAKSLTQLSLYHMILANYELSTQLAEEAISHYEALEDERGAAEVKYAVAGIYYKTDNFHLGLTYLVDALKIFEKYNDWHNQSRALKSLGTIYEYISDQNNAAIAYENAVSTARKAGDADLESNAYNNLSGLLLKRGNTGSAMDLIESSIRIKKQTGDTRGYAFAIYGRGKVYLSMGDHPKAEADFKCAIDIHREMGERLGLAMALNKLGRLYLKDGMFEHAEQVALESHQLSKEYNIAITRFKSDYLLYQIAKTQGQHEQALLFLERYMQERERVINVQTLKVIENYEIIIRMRTLEKEAELQRERSALIEKKNRAEEGVRVRQEFLSNMSHEIRTPLNAITTIVSLLGKQATPEDNSLLESMKFASNNLIRIVNDILDFTKLDAGKAILAQDPGDLRSLVNNIVSTYEGLAYEKGITLNLSVDSRIASTYLLDATKLTQIAGNLISNAIKFTESGEVSMDLIVKKQGLTHDTVCFRIQDTGEGIGASHLDEIFDSFSQIKPVLTRTQGGTGLGLAIVKKLVSLHGSDIRVESTPGIGSTFYFDLILEKSIPAMFVPEDIEPTLDGKSVLLVEDTHINAVLMMKLLSKWGIVTDHVLNGRLALEMSRSKKYDFILMDIHMPEMNGFEATRQIRSYDGYNRNIPIFAVTADVMTKDEEQYAEYFTGFLWKPLEIEKLHAALASAAAG